MNCAALPDTLIESEMFGHEKGAFTGAAERRAGYFELANGGTLLLDEIGEMPISTQAKLLRVLEERKIRRLGGDQGNRGGRAHRGRHQSRPARRHREGHFPRRPLLPPQCFRSAAAAAARTPRRHSAHRPRPAHGLNKRHECRVTDLAPDVLALFAEYPWSGNVRELRNVLERAVILAGEGVIRREHLPPDSPACRIASWKPRRAK